MNCPNCNHEIDLHEHDAEVRDKAWNDGYTAGANSMKGNERFLRDDEINEVRKPLVDALLDARRALINARFTPDSELIRKIDALVGGAAYFLNHRAQCA